MLIVVARSPSIDCGRIQRALFHPCREALCRRGYGPCGARWAILPSDFTIDRLTYHVGFLMAGTGKAPWLLMGFSQGFDDHLDRGSMAPCPFSSRAHPGRLFCQAYVQATQWSVAPTDSFSLLYCLLTLELCYLSICFNQSVVRFVVVFAGTSPPLAVRF